MEVTRDELMIPTVADEVVAWKWSEAAAVRFGRVTWEKTSVMLAAPGTEVDEGSRSTAGETLLLDGGEALAWWSTS